MEHAAPDVLGGHVDSAWMTPQSNQDDEYIITQHSQTSTWPHIDEGVTIPFPDSTELHELKAEFFQRRQGDPLGPASKRWEAKAWDWSVALREKHFGKTKRVTGLWQQASKRWSKRLSRLQDSCCAKALMNEIRQGVPLPFVSKPPGRVWSLHNHKNLSERRQQVYEALIEQLDEGSLEGFDVTNGQRPMGLLSLRWVEKSDPSKVRLTLNGRPLNKFFPGEECTINLQTHSQLRPTYVKNQSHVGFDLHNGFFHQQYVKAHRTWVSFRISDKELGHELATRLRSRTLTSWVNGHCYFSYRGLVMGLSPSCQQLQRIMQALMDVWMKCKVSGINWAATNFIDDSMAWMHGAFEGYLELSLRLLAEYTLLGFSLNTSGKSTLFPTRYYCHIGVVINSSSMRFSLPARRSTKMKRCRQELFDKAKVGEKINAKLVARFVGQLWSADIVCHRAVAIMARGITRTISLMLHDSGVNQVTDAKMLKRLLKRVWWGNVVWTDEAQKELDFWMRVDFSKLSAPISYDAVSSGLSAWVASADSGMTSTNETVSSSSFKLSKHVKVFAVDTSDSMSGGGEFIRDGHLWRMTSGMAVRLTPEEVLTSSTLRELLGVERLDLALVPQTCRKLLLLIDSMAAYYCLLNGSRIEELQEIVRRIFLNQLKHNRVLWPIWLRRDSRIIKLCDDMSRWIDRHAQITPSYVFWRANKKANMLWGKGFQLDTCADMHNVQPRDRQTRLPFFSRWPSPHSSGVDMLQQSWRHMVCWCNPPFILLPRVVALMRAQQVCGAVVAPCNEQVSALAGLSSAQHWVRGTFDFNYDQRVDASKVNVTIKSQKLRVFFVDFRQSTHPSSFIDRPAADSFPKLSDPKNIVYQSLT